MIAYPAVVILMTNPKLQCTLQRKHKTLSKEMLNARKGKVANGPDRLLRVLVPDRSTSVNSRRVRECYVL